MRRILTFICGFAFCFGFTPLFPHFQAAQPAHQQAALPGVTAYSLAGARVALPAAFTTPRNLLILSFARDQQDEVDGWIPVARAIEKTSAQEHSLPVETWVLPVSSHENRLYQWWVNSSLRDNLPGSQSPQRTVPLYVNKPKFLRSLGIQSEKHVVVLLTDKEGQVLWRASGAVTDTEKASLAAVLRPAKPGTT